MTVPLDWCVQFKREHLLSGESETNLLHCAIRSLFVGSLWICCGWLCTDGELHLAAVPMRLTIWLILNNLNELIRIHH